MGLVTLLIEGVRPGHVESDRIVPYVKSKETLFDKCIIPILWVYDKCVSDMFMFGRGPVPW